MNRLVATVIVPTLVGCSSVGVHSETARDAEESTRDVELTALRLENEEQEQELRVLRSQLALARSEVDELKANEGRESSSKPATTGGDTLPWDERAHVETMPMALDGEIAAERLAVTSDIPDLPAFEPPMPAPTEPEKNPSVEGYRRALDLIRQERFGEALLELDAFVETYPSHPYTDNALFWCGEIHYLRREYTQALECFERVEKLYPWGNKAPDALYRMGQIYLRRGDKPRARAYFDKVREQFPNTAAARLALREDAS